MNKNAVLVLRCMDGSSDPVNRCTYVVPLYTKYIKCISVFFALFKNDAVTHKVVLIFMLCHIFDFETPMGKEMKGVILNLKDSY